MDILVTTPKKEMDIAEREAKDCIDSGGGSYFRKFVRKPKDLNIGDKVFYVEDGYIRGFAIVSDIIDGNMRCNTSGKNWGDAYYAIMDSKTWKWIDPIPHKGFQGWRYFDSKDIEVVGGWKDSRPKVSWYDKKKRE